MENASKALLMGGGILVGVLILALMATLLISSKKMSTGYEERKQSEALQQFNVNFTKYLGKELTIHDVVTICNFANENDVFISQGKKHKDNILEELKKEEQLKETNRRKYYELQTIKMVEYQ